MSMLCDIREREFISKVPNISTQTLSVGDIWIGLSGEDVRPGGLVIERKTVADFEASILDGRYHEQRVRLLTYCQQKGARPVYIIEGCLDRISGRFTENVLRQYLNRLQIRYGVCVIQTDSLTSTIELCQTFEKQIEKDSAVFVLEDGAQKSYTHCVSINKKGNRDDPKVVASLMLQQCPGLSATAADALLAAFQGTFTGVFGADESAIASVQVTEKRKIGPALAKRLFTLLHS